MVAVAAWLFLGAKAKGRQDLVLHRVKHDKLQLTIVERGALESAENSDVVCRVKARSGSSTVASTIRWVIDDGTQVSRGDKLIELDDSALQDQLKTQKIDLDNAQSTLIQAEENLKITQSQNVSDLETAKLNLDLARIDLKKYLEGEYLQSKRDIEGRMLMAQSDLDMWEERSAWSSRMSKPGRRYVTQAQAQSDTSRKQSADVAMDKVKEEMRVLERYTNPRQVKSLEGAIAEAGRALDRVGKQAIAKEATGTAALAAARSVYEQKVSQYADTEEEIKKCLVLSPQDGMVVYYVPEQSRFGTGSQQSIVAQGEPVREGQKLMRIPDLNKMLVNTRVHEAMVSKVHGENWHHTGFLEGVQTGLMVTPGPFLAPAVEESAFLALQTRFQGQYKGLDQTMTDGGQKAKVRVDAYPDRMLDGHVKTVATVASQQDFLSSDVKVYQTMVEIDEPLGGLKPGMSAEVTIFTDSQRKDVLTVPIQAILGSVDMGRTRKVFVMTPEGPKMRDITVGMSNDKMAEVESGLAENDEVVLNPRALLSDKERAKFGDTGKPAGSPEGKEGKEGKGKAKDGKGKGKGPGGKGPDGGGPPA